MLGMLRATFQRVRHACRQTVCRGRCCRQCAAASRRHRERPGRLDSSPTSTSTPGSTSACEDLCESAGVGGGGGPSGGGLCTCGACRLCYLCCLGCFGADDTGVDTSTTNNTNTNNGNSGSNLCDWISSWILPFDWIPLATSAAPSGGGGEAFPSAARGAEAGGSGHGARGGSWRGDFGRGGGERLAEGGVSEVGGAGSARRGVAAGGDDAKPLLSESSSFEFREKERRFVKGQFVIPGSDVQRKLAEAMAGMLAINPNRNKGGAVIGQGDGYRQIGHDDSDARGTEGPPPEEPGGVPARALGRTSSGSSGTGGSLSRRASPRKSVSSPSEILYAVGSTGGGAGGGGDGTDNARECVICMDDFTKEDPEMLTLCSCGVNKTFFHYSCLLQWLAKHSYCPACRGYLYFEERHMGSGERSRSVPAGRGRSPPTSNDDYGQAFQRALRAGLEAADGGRSDREADTS